MTGVQDNTISHEDLNYITGYFQYHTQRKHNLGTHTSNMKPEDENTVQFRIMCLSRSGTVEPDEEFLKYWSPTASSGIIKDLLTYLKVDLPVEVVKIFVKSQTLIHLNSVNVKNNSIRCSNHRKSNRKVLKYI
jgi:hypothetical protein